MNDKMMRKLRSIGIECFIEYFDDFVTCEDNIVLSNKIQSERGYTRLSCNTRVTKSKSIINNKEDLLDALNYIISAGKVDQVVQKKAKNIKSDIFEN